MKYGSSFFDYVDSGAIRSAEIVVAALFPQLKPTTVLDVGCGRGAWAREWKQHGATIIGVDGDYVERSQLHIAAEEFRSLDLAKPFDLGRRFDVVQSLEVAEHLPPGSSASFADSMTAHGDIIVFSAAVPGQGGTGHINERPLEYWRQLFGERGYSAFDYIRPLLSTDARIEPWYRLNTVVYANASGQERLDVSMRESAVPSDKPLKDYAAMSWRMRRAIVRHLPVTTVDRLAAVNAFVRKLRPRG